MRLRLDALVLFLPLAACDGAPHVVTFDEAGLCTYDTGGVELVEPGSDTGASADDTVPPVDTGATSPLYDTGERPLYDTGELPLPGTGRTSSDVPAPLDTAAPSDTADGTPVDTAAPSDTADGTPVDTGTPPAVDTGAHVDTGTPPEVANPADDTATADTATGEPADDTAPSDPLELLCHRDEDGDGFGDPATLVVCITGDPLTVADDSDCDDAANDTFPGATELCDGLDNDCNGVVDDDYALDATVFYADADGDTYGDPSTGVSSCSAPIDHVEDRSDCDDADATTSPEGTEVCDGLDNDCSGEADDNDAGCADEPPVVDDGPGDTATLPVDTGGAGSPPADTGDTALDTGRDSTGGSTGDGTPPADDADGAPSDDCTGTWYADVDGDGYGDALAAVSGCRPDESYVRNDDDCDSSDADVNPEGEEACDGADNDCDGVVDESDATDSPPWYRDADGDGYGVGSETLRACAAPSGFVADAADCDDTSAAVSPAATEVCDGIDNDCNEGADEVSATDALTWFFDADGDGYGGLLVRTACTQPTDAYAAPLDCNDGDAAISPAAAEVCNDVDDDCNGAVDDAATVGAQYFYADADGDGYGDPADAVWACSTPDAYVDNDEDCDDTTSGTFPGHRERCDGADNNCDGNVDESGSVGETRWYLDADGDGYGTGSVSTEACDLPTGYSASRDDCDDADDGAFPGNVEVCGDRVDNDCDGVSERCGPWGERDADGGDAFLYGESAGDDAGRRVAFLGDVDGDGHDEIGVGAPLHDGSGTSSGAAYVLGAPEGDTALATATARLLGSAGSLGGWSLAGVGDLDGDGLDDVVVGAYTDATAGSGSGSAFLLVGPLAGDTLLTSARAQLTGGAVDDWAGYAVDGVGDATGDGTPDVLVASPYEDAGGSKAGAVYLVSGTSTGRSSLAGATAKLVGEVSLDRAGTSAAGAGDVDGDGIMDLVVGAWGDSAVGARSGAAYLVLGPVSGVLDLSLADTKWTGEATGHRAGWSVDGGADLDGDGLDDALVGSPLASRAYVVGNAGGVLSLSGASAVLRHPETSHKAGTSVAAGGDLDADGAADLAVGTPGDPENGTEAGSVLVVRGPVSGSVDLDDADGLLHGLVSRDQVGTSLALDGDTDGDGFSDLLFGAPGNDDNGDAAGGAYLFYGARY